MSGKPDTQQIHASCVALSGAGVLLRGPSGAGKSDLSLRLIADGATLIADDRVDLFIRNAELCARAPDALAGMIEMRGVGIATLPFDASAVISLVVDLVPRSDVPRLPERAEADLLGRKIRLLKLAAFEHSTPAKIKFALMADGNTLIGAA